MAKETEKIMKFLLMAMLVSVTVSAIASEPHNRILLSAYIRLGMTKAIEQRIQTMGKDLPPMDAAQLSTSSRQWKQERLSEIRVELTSAYGKSASKIFSSFVAEYTEAESKNDTAYLADLAGHICPDREIPGYSALRKLISEESPTKEFSDGCVKLMSNIEAWVTLTKKDAAMPPLHIWLSRNIESRRSANGVTSPSVNRLRNAESVSDIDLTVLNESSQDLLSQYEATKHNRNEAKQARAKEGMAQLAKERTRYEDAYAKKLLARTATDAEAMKLQARRIASAEKEAIKQHENSWGMKLKRIAGATVGATADAFFGGIGARAGAEAVKILF